ncbi:DUF3618 domain-containing protein [Nocardioides dongxiaopingii]|jgi:uncharacterized membrane protein (UPF0136 family)|uniref:DUF3618 domain-containing protein n=1 Tax=Nocardioides sp. S-1144 TaxID=2582905 RepID=UPI00110E8CE4|nr:DUF3618 domain-containing protein [Nocardioides sp. S-1144]QCW51954.1 DUF3618 domain-containing protein [Nocardioides sp. S-1144]
MSDSNDPEAIQADIERTRADLAATVDQLTGRLQERKTQAKDLGVKVAAGGAAVLLLVVVVRVVRSRRSS